LARAASFFLAAMLATKVTSVHAEASPQTCFSGIDLFNITKSHFWPATMIDYSLHGNATDLQITNLIDSGVGFGELFVEPMRQGRTQVSNVALAAPAERLRAILHTISTKLGGERLPYLNLLLIGPPELRDEAQTLIEGLQATLIFVPNEMHRCEKLSVGAHSSNPASP
jgi:hypothetical protein